ncbi:LysR family transcriptional regulator [Cupriavidus basilensis]|nr:LysR family transcriptional regulator [Cupriavidus basilensis]
MMDLRRLSHVLALADALHFARAAERVHLSQPAFSRSIQAIETDLGIRLFDRDVGDVRPTPAGEFVIERARRLLFDARCLQRDVDLFRDSQLGDTAFGAGPFPAATLMPPALSELRRRYPKVALRVEASNWTQLLERLRAEDIEFFVADVRDLPEDPALEIRPLGTQHGFFYVRTSHPLAGRECTVADAWPYGVAATKLPSGLRAELAKVLGLPAASKLCSRWSATTSPSSGPWLCPPTRSSPPRTRPCKPILTPARCCRCASKACLRCSPRWVSSACAIGPRRPWRKMPSPASRGSLARSTSSQPIRPRQLPSP